MKIINTSLNTNWSQVAELGIKVRPANPNVQLWELSSITIHNEISHLETGTVCIIAHDPMGCPIQSEEFIFCWADGVAYMLQDYPGRFTMKLDRVYDPTVEHGPYWVSALEDGIGPEVVGIGIPKGHKIEIKIILMKCGGGA